MHAMVHILPFLTTQKLSVIIYFICCPSQLSRVTGWLTIMKKQTINIETQKPLKLKLATTKYKL